MKRMQDDVLGPALREEGRRIGAGFSRLFHERVMRALAECGVEASPERRRGHWRVRAAAPLGLAAALAIAAGTWVVLHPVTRPDKSAPVASKPGPLEMPNLQQVREAFAPEAAPAPEENETLEQARYASLNRDAQTFVSFVADQVPSFSSDAQ